MDKKKEAKSFSIMLSVISGVLIGLAFPPSPLYSLAYVAFVPFLYVLAKNESYLKVAFYSYLFLLVFQLITLYWVGGYVVGKDIWMMIAGAALIIFHPIFYIPFILLSVFIRKKLGLIIGMLSFALLWVSFEYLHSIGEYSFPWLTIANSQAYDTNRIQIIEYISVYGLSFLIILFNLLGFFTIWLIANGYSKNRMKVTILLLIMASFYFGLAFYGKMMVERESVKDTDQIRVGIIQPNFDPWEKWEGKGNRWESYNFQFNTYIEWSKHLSAQYPDIIIWPETAIPFHILLPGNQNYLLKLYELVDSIKIPILSGLPTCEYYNSSNRPATAQKIDQMDLFFESYNSIALFMQKGKVSPIHRKTILVPFAERIPYAETFRFLIEPLKWNIGISSWGKGNDTIVWTLVTKNGKNICFSGMICYESVYPDYVKEFVRKGAQFLVVITNDSWWGNTSGAYQHAAFASLRAVETRRWIVQCANGGISMLVDPAGRQILKTKLYTQARFTDEIGIRNDLTFYTKYGDITAHSLLFLSSLLTIYAIVYKRKLEKKN